MSEKFEKFVKVSGVVELIFFKTFFEIFAKVPGVVELRWRSDDPEFSVPPTDLFEEQARGIPEWSRSIMIHFADKRTDMICLISCVAGTDKKTRGQLSRQLLLVSSVTAISSLSRH